MAGLLGSPWLGGSAVAATTTYSGTTGAFTIGAGDTALLINGADITGDVLNDGTLQFDLSTNLTVSNLISGLGDVALTNSGTITFSGSNSYLAGTTVSYGALVITSGGVISHSGTDANMIVGSLAGDVGTLRLSGGRVSVYDGNLGKDVGSTGTAFVTSGTWANAHDLNIGYSGTGAVTISGGSVTVAGSTLVGRDLGSSGALTVSGGRLDVASVLQVGFGGDGTMLVNGGSVFSHDGYIGVNANSSGTATITSGSWTIGGDLLVGQAYGGSATLNISNGGVVSVAASLSREPTLGTINLGAGGTLIIGTGTDSGALNTDLTNNGTLIFDRSNFSQYGYLISGTGNVIKRGAGTLQLTGSNSYSGGTEILDGTIDVTYGGAIDHRSATLAIGDSSGAIGILGVSGGYVGSSLLDLSNGEFNLSDGLVETGTADIGVFGTGTATISGGTWSILESLYVGSSGTGTMDVTGSGIVTSGTVTSPTASTSILGRFAGDLGTVTVTNGGQWNSYGNLTVGGGGTGVLTISDQGSVLVTGTLSKGAGGSAINLNTFGTLKIGNGGTTGALATDLTNDGTLIFERSNAYTYSGMISGMGAVTKSGTGSLTFSGSNSYTGITSIEAGSFYIDGHLGQTAVVVHDGALLGGSGTVLGGVTVGDVSGTAVLSPGSLSDAYATLHLGSLELTAGALTRMSVSGTQAGLNYDQIAGVGDSPTLVYGGDMEITLSGSYADNTTFHLFTDFTGGQSGEFRSISLNAFGAYAALSGTFSYNAESGVWATNWTSARQRLEFSTVTGDLIVVPEPSTLVMGAVGVGVAGLLRWRRRRQRAARLALDQTSDRASDQV